MCDRQNRIQNRRTYRNMSAANPTTLTPPLGTVPLSFSGDGTAHASTETEMTCQRFHTESRMRENCTYGSMRGRTYPTGASRSTLHMITTVNCHSSADFL